MAKMDTEVQLKESVILEQYRALQSETLSRITEHHKLWFYKLITCGAILSFILSRDTCEIQYGSIVVPLLALFFDALMVNNLLLIGSIGAFLSEFYEKKYEIDGWDSLDEGKKYGAQKQATWKNDWAVLTYSTLGLFVISMFHILIIKACTSLGVIVLMIFILVILVWHIYRSYLLLIKKSKKTDIKCEL